MSRAIITFIVLSLLGLIIIQANMLRIGHTTEAEKYDAEVSAIMYNISTDLFENTQLSRKIAQLSQESDIDKRTIYSNDSLPFYTVKEIDTLFKEQLAARGISVDYAFALTDEKNQLILNSPNFDANRFKFNRYARPLGLVKRICNCEVLIHFYQKNLNTYLFGQLAYLLIPSFLFLLMIIAGFSLLIYTVNRQKRLLVIKNDFINNLTHELKTPVFSISLLTKVFRERLKLNQTKKLEEYIGLMETENQKLKGHIDKVLELASLENGKYSLQRENCDLHSLINEAVKEVTLKIDSAQGHLVKNFQAIKGQLLLDRVHFKNVIQNLLDNAIKYSNGQPSIAISTSNTNKKLVIAVSDQGVGIAPEHHRHLFDKFYRVTTGNLHNIKGFGLGLSYVKYIVEAHGGDIRVQSKEAEGTTFIMEFPVA